MERKRKREDDGDGLTDDSGDLDSLLGLHDDNSLTMDDDLDAYDLDAFEEDPDPQLSRYNPEDEAIEPNPLCLAYSEAYEDCLDVVNKVLEGFPLPDITAGSKFDERLGCIIQNFEDTIYIPAKPFRVAFLGAAGKGLSISSSSLS